MRIAKIEDLHCDAGWRTWSFLKITTDDGVVGWSEYNESYGSRGLTAVIQKLAERLIGLDPRPVERLTAMLHGVSPLDRPTWVMATAALVVVGLLATLIPAQRATRADPLLAIRSE